MTILHVSTPATWRGGEQQVAYLASALQQLQVDQVILSPEGSVLGARMMESNIPVASFTTRGYAKAKTLISSTVTTHTRIVPL